MVIFDCDGVLVDSESITNRILQKSLAGYSLDLSLEQLTASFTGGTMAGVMIKARGMGAALPDDWLETFYAELYEILGNSVEMVPYVTELLDLLDEAGIIYAVGSNGRMRKMEITLGRTGLWDRFEGRIFSSYDCPAPKPAPDVYLKAARFAGIAPSECVVVEDSATGAFAAVAAKIPCFGFCAETDRALLEPHCVEVFSDMSKLPKLLGL
jgi:HAD superfamily hydrolase (TIGR01509 family)